MRKPLIALQLDPQMLDELDDFARARGLSRSACVRACIDVCFAADLPPVPRWLDPTVGGSAPKRREHDQKKNRRRRAA